ncbi:uncharacterized protein [Drosophila kikkawai]|uniref:Glycosyltransferase family 92 protein n=1 Tax=Drosophila kikkawai TaxID=30033 RepID=A0A6P4J0Y0_DROKI|nr:uncharacterized protein LOC108079316 [Drosophila kikkawai]
MMVWLRSLRAPLCVCVLGSLFLVLLFRLAGPPLQDDHKALLEETRKWRAELDLLKLNLERHKDKDKEKDKELKLEAKLEPKLEPKLESRPEPEPDLETLLRSNEDENWAHGPECAPYPRYENLEFHSPHFQKTQHGNLTYYLYGAYYDRRPRVAELVILAMITTCTDNHPPTYCQMWFEGETLPELVPLHESKLAWFPQWGQGEGVPFPTLLTFQMQSPRQPQLVALVFGNGCAVPQNALKVIQPPVLEEERVKAQPRLRTGICVKYLRFPDVDISERLVEWLELMRLLGAGKIRAFDIGQLHPNISRTLAYYTRPEDGLLELRPYQMLPTFDGKTELCRQLNEVLLYNDCLYRSLYEFDYVAVMDVDEVIMPLGRQRSWPDLLEELEAADVNCSARCGYCFSNVYFPKELAPDPKMESCFYMLAHVTRVAEHLDPALAAKCLHNTAYSTVMHNHFAIQWRESCGPQHVDVEMGQMQHYRHVDILETLVKPPPKLDDNIRRFQKQLMRNVRAVHRQLGWPGAT